MEPAFYNDKEVARLLSMSPSWVRGQRFRRQHGEEHIFDLDPCYLGKSPRYSRASVEAFVEGLAK